MVQQNPGSVNSVITFTRQTNFIKRFDYTYFSSPVDGQQLNTIGVDIGNYFGGTLVPPLFDKYFYWDAFATPDPGNAATLNTGKWTNVLETSTMETCKGYIIRAPQSFPAIPSQKWTVAFTGEPHNAPEYTYPISGSTYTTCTNPTTKVSPNLIGNPYPCAIDLDTFLTHPFNKDKINGAVYFWTHRIPLTQVGNGTYQYVGDDYILYNVLGGLGYRVGGDPNMPNGSNRNRGRAASCQSFFVNGTVAGGSTIKFTTDMRDSTAPDTSPLPNDLQFYKASTLNNTNDITAIPPPIAVSIVKNRIWLSLEQGTTGNGSLYKETLIGYTNGQANTINGSIPASTNGYEKLYDAETISLNNTIQIYSVLNSTTPCPKLAIQGRAFNTNDVVNLGITCPAGTYRIKAELWDGIFTNSQDFLLREDNGNGTFSLYDIKNTPYVLNTSVALTDNVTRFQLVFVPPILMQITNQCGTILGNSSNTFYTNINVSFIPPVVLSGINPIGTTAYVWRIIAPNGTYIKTTSPQVQKLFNLLPSTALFYNSNYTIQVAAVINGVQQPFSNSTCVVTTTAPPVPLLESVCGSTLTTFSSTIDAVNAPYASGYSWKVTRTDTGQIGIINTLLRSLKLTQITNILPIGGPTFVQANKQYCVEVAVRYNANTQISAYSSVCCFNTGLAKMNPISNNPFEINDFAIAYPNPFTNNFNLKLATVNNEGVEVKVYDMFGKLVESYNMLDSEIENLEIGNNYNSGIYNIVISSSDNVFTQRIIKR